MSDFATLMQMMSTTPGDIKRSVQGEEATLQKLLQDTNQSRAYTDDLRSQTAKRIEEQPYLTRKLQFESDPKLLKSTNDSTIAKNTAEQLKAEQWIANAPREDFIKATQQMAHATAQTMQGWKQVIQSSATLEEALPILRKSVNVEDPKQRQQLEQAFQWLTSEVAAGKLDKNSAVDFLDKGSQAVVQNMLSVDPETMRATLLKQMEIDKKNAGDGPKTFQEAAIRANPNMTYDQYLQAAQSLVPGLRPTETSESLTIDGKPVGVTSTKTKTVGGSTATGQGSQMTPERRAKIEKAAERLGITPPKTNGQPAMSQPTGSGAGSALPAEQGSFLERQEFQPVNASLRGTPSLEMSRSIGSSQESPEMFSGMGSMQNAPANGQAIPPGKSNNPLATYMNLEPRPDETLNRFNQRLIHENYAVLSQYYLNNESKLSDEQKWQIKNTLYAIEDHLLPGVQKKNGYKFDKMLKDKAAERQKKKKPNSGK